MRLDWPYRHPPSGAFRLNRDSQQAKGLVFWAPLMGPRAFDYISGKDLVKIGTTTAYTNGVEGRLCWTFNGVNGDGLYLDSTVATAVPVTMLAWVYCLSDTGNQIAVSIGDTAANNDFFALRYSGNVAGDPIRAGSSVGGTESLASTTVPYPINTWSHATAVFSSATARESYLNANAITRGANATSSTPASLDRIGIGHRATLAAGNNIIGYIADVRIYNRILSRQEIFAIWEISTRWELFEPVVKLYAGATPSCEPITFYATATKPSGSEYFQLQAGGVAPASARLGTGWTVGTATPTLYSRMDTSVERVVGDHTSTVQPFSPLDTTLGDGWRSEVALNGVFIAGWWSLSFQVQGQTRSTSTTDGRLRIRIYIGSHADGTSSVELTSSAIVTTGYTNLSNTVAQTLTGTVFLGLTTLVDSYLFIQVAHELQGAGDNANCDVMLCIGPSVYIQTPCFDGAFTYSSALSFSILHDLGDVNSTAQDALVTAQGPVTLDRLHTLTQSALANTIADLALGRLNVLLSSATSVEQSSISLAKLLAITLSALSVEQGVLTLAKLEGMVTSALSVEQGVLTLAKLNALVTAATSIEQGSLTLIKLLAIALAAQSTAQGAVTLAKLADEIVSASATGEGTFVLAELLGLSAGGSATALGTLTLAESLGISTDTSLTLFAALTLDRSNTLTQAAISQALGNLALDKVLIVSLAGVASALVSLSLDSDLFLNVEGEVQAVGQLNVDVFLELGETLEVAAQATSAATVALLRQNALTISALGTLLTALSLDRSNSLALAGVTQAGGAFSLDKALILSTASAASALASLTLSMVRLLATEGEVQAVGLLDVTLSLGLHETLAVNAQTIAQATTALLRQNGLSAAAVSTSRAAISLGHSESLEASVIVRLQVAVTLSRQETLSLLAQAETQASLFLNELLGLDVQGRLFTLTITPPERVYMVEPECNEFVVEPEDENEAAIQIEIRFVNSTSEYRVYLVAELERIFTVAVDCD